MQERLRVGAAEVDRHDEWDAGASMCSSQRGGPSVPVVISEGAVSEPPRDWKDSLALHGRLGIVVRSGPLGRAMLYIRSEDGIGARSLFESSAVCLPGFEPKAAFVF